MTDFVQIQSPLQPYGFWLFSSLLLLPAALTHAEERPPVIAVLNAAPAAPAETAVPLSEQPTAATVVDELPPLVDLSFPDLQASLPPLELVDPEPTDAPVVVERVEPKRGLVRRVRDWFYGDARTEFMAEPMISVAVVLVDRLPDNRNEATELWAQPALPNVDPLSLSEPLAALSAEQSDAALNLLQKNIGAALSRVTVEDFADFADSVPRLRSLARDAAQAVGFYDSQFFFRQQAADQLQVDVLAGAPVRVVSALVKAPKSAEPPTADQVTAPICVPLPQDDEPQPALTASNTAYFVRGEVFNHAKYEQVKGCIEREALQHGYFEGAWDRHDVEVILPDDLAKIELIYQYGTQYKFGEVAFASTVDGRPLPVRRELLDLLLPFAPGDWYDAQKVQTLSRQLLDTRWFNNIEVTAFTPDAIKNQQASPSTPLAPPLSNSLATATTSEQPRPVPASAPLRADSLSSDGVLSAAARANVVPVRVLLDARQPNSAEAGIGYGTDTGVRFRSQYRRALVNDRGHSLDANLELSAIRQAIDTRYSLPYQHPLTDTLSVFGGFEREEVAQLDTDFTIQSFGGTLGVERSIRPSPQAWQRSLSLRYRVDQVDVKFADLAAARLVDPTANDARLSLTQQVLLAGYSWNKVRSRGGVDPYEGLRQLYQIEVGSQALLSDVDLTILRAGWRTINSFTENRKHRVVGRVDLATILTNQFEQVPYNLRFFAGGDQSIRGYDYKSLSTVRDGELSGGQNLAVASLEYNYQFLSAWRGAVFVDAGNAFDERFADDVKVGAGLGIRWSSPIGPVRVDVAAGLSEASIPIRLHFFIGPSL